VQSRAGRWNYIPVCQRQRWLIEHSPHKRRSVRCAPLISPNEIIKVVVLEHKVSEGICTIVAHKSRVQRVGGCTTIIKKQETCDWIIRILTNEKAVTFLIWLKATIAEREWPMAAHIHRWSVR
jgi:hypothetical protein